MTYKSRLHKPSSQSKEENWDSGKLSVHLIVLLHNCQIKTHLVINVNLKYELNWIEIGKH